MEGIKIGGAIVDDVIGGPFFRTEERKGDEGRI